MIGLAASLLGIGRWLREAAGAAFRWVMAHPAQAALIAALLALWWQHGTLNGVRKDLVAMERARDAEKAARLVTIANYREASKRAQEAAEANVARVKKEQEQINERRVDALEERLAVGQSRYDRLRIQSEAHSRSSSEAGMSAASEAACQAHAGTACEAIPALLKAAQDNTDTLIELQGWAKDQGAVEVDGGP